MGEIREQICRGIKSLELNLPLRVTVGTASMAFIVMYITCTKVSTIL